MKVILSHAGKQHAYHVAKALQDMGYLEKFYTSSYITSGKLQQLIRFIGNTFWSRRFLDGLSGMSVEANWRFEIPEIINNKLYGQTSKTIDAIYTRDMRFDAHMADRMQGLRGEVFWGFQGSCFNSLKVAKQSGKLVICELATAHAPAAKRILEEEKELHPEWADSIDNVSFPDFYYQRLCEEPHLADIVIGASQFTLQTLREAGVAETKLRYLPLGFELEHIPFEEKRSARKGPLKLLFAGRITQRKGIKYLLEAMKEFHPQQVELHIIGYVHGSSSEAFRGYKNFTLHSPLQQYELFKKYQDFDAFILPSVFEGFGLVVLEAMAAGLPVITTTHTIGPELIENGSNGYLVPIRDVASIVNAIQSHLGKDDEERNLMRRLARKSAVRFTWANYAMRLQSVLNNLQLSTESHRRVL